MSATHTCYKYFEKLIKSTLWATLKVKKNHLQAIVLFESFMLPKYKHLT